MLATKILVGSRFTISIGTPIVNKSKWKYIKLKYCRINGVLFIARSYPSTLLFPSMSKPIFHLPYLE